MSRKNNKKDNHRFRKVKVGVASAIVATSFVGGVTPLLTESATVLAAEANQAENEVEDSQFKLDSFRLTHLENHEGLFSNRIGGQLKISLTDDVSEGEKLSIDIYQESEAYNDGNKEAVRRFEVGTVTPVTVDDGDETVVVGQFDGSTITFNSTIEDYESVQLTVHVGTVVEPSYLHYYVTEEETRTEVVPYTTEIRYVYDPAMSEGEEEVLIEGVDGERTIVENVTYYLGDEANRELISEEVTTDPIQEIIAVGVANAEEELTEVEPSPDEDNNNEPEARMDLSAANEPVLVDEYNQTGVNHIYHVYLNDEHAGTTAIGFETPASLEIREERANDFENVTSRLAINEEGKVNTRLTFADIFSQFSSNEEVSEDESIEVPVKDEVDVEEVTAEVPDNEENELEEASETPTEVEYDEDGNPIADDTEKNLEEELENEESIDGAEEDNAETDEENSELEEDEEPTTFGERLPDTATSAWTIGAIGGGLLSVGGITKWLDSRKKKKSSDTKNEK